MKKALLLLALVIMGTFVMSGCNGVADNYNERAARYRNITNYNCRQVPDDWDEFWLYDRPSGLTRYGN